MKARDAENMPLPAVPPREAPRIESTLQEPRGRWRSPALPLSSAEYSKVRAFGLHRRQRFDDSEGMHAGVLVMGVIVLGLVLLGVVCVGLWGLPR